MLASQLTQSSAEMTTPFASKLMKPVVFQEHVPTKTGRPTPVHNQSHTQHSSSIAAAPLSQPDAVAKQQHIAKELHTIRMYTTTGYIVQAHCCVVTTGE